MQTFAEAEVRLAETLPGYESRPQQQRLAEAVEQTFAENGPTDIPRHLIAQAGCGTGKSLGYGIPSILLGKRVIISVTTKALQDQLSEKDIPFLQENLGVPFSWAVLKGRSNYFCPERAADQADELGPVVGQLLEASKVDGFTGERDSFPFQIEDRVWAAVHADVDECSARECSRELVCFAQRAREYAKHATVVIVNHALFFTDLLIRDLTDGYVSMLDEYDFVVFDEAHEVEDVATNSLGANFTEASFTLLVNQVRSFAERYADNPDEVVALGHQDVFEAVPALWQRLELGRLRLAGVLKIQNELVALNDAMTEFRKGVVKIKLDGVSGDIYTKIKRRKDALLKRTDSLIFRLQDIIAAEFGDVVRWVEEERKQFRGQWVTRKILKSAPIDVAPYLSRMLFEVTPCILTSATLEVNGGFDYIAGRLGIEHFDSLDVGTPFDFSKQALTYVPRHLPEPVRDQVRNWETQVNEEIIDLCKASNGRALILFTSTKHMRSAFEACEKRIPHTVFVQGQMPQKRLVEAFRDDTHSVLFATRSYFTGVDIQGDSLSLVAIAKMPFPVPTEPMTEARCEVIKANGGNDFSEYTIPVMSLILQQGYGRLIRHRNDRGVVAILDPRLITKGYGKKILHDLPGAPVATSLDEVEAFFARAAEAVPA